MSNGKKIQIAITAITLILFLVDSYMPGRSYSSQIKLRRIQQDQNVRSRGSSGRYVEKIVVYFDTRHTVVEDVDALHFTTGTDIKYEVSPVFRVLRNLKADDYVSRVRTNEYLSLCVLLCVLCAAGNVLSKNPNPNVTGFLQTLWLASLGFTWYIFLFR
jgi:hypothetical protein